MEKIIRYILIAVICVLLAALGVFAVNRNARIHDLESSLAEYRSLATSSINGLIADNRSIRDELEQQRGNTESAVEAITRAIAISENSATAYSKLSSLSDEDRKLLDRLRNNIAASLRIIKGQLEKTNQ